MSHLIPAMKSPKVQKNETPTAPAAGPHGIARRPPHYGIEIVDRAADGAGPFQLLPQPDRKRGREEMAPDLSRDRPLSALNHTGLPNRLKSGIESLSGLSMDNVRVHYNSSQPEQLNALAYTQGTDIHVAPGQEQHLPHEAWHVVQQAQGRVQPRFELKGEQIDDDLRLEHEAWVMGAKAIKMHERIHELRGNSARRHEASHLARQTRVRAWSATDQTALPSQSSEHHLATIQRVIMAKNGNREEPLDVDQVIKKLKESDDIKNTANVDWDAVKINFLSQYLDNKSHYFDLIKNEFKTKVSEGKYILNPKETKEDTSVPGTLGEKKSKPAHGSGVHPKKARTTSLNKGKFYDKIPNLPSDRIYIKDIRKRLRDTNKHFASATSGTENVEEYIRALKTIEEYLASDPDDIMKLQECLQVVEKCMGRDLKYEADLYRYYQALKESEKYLSSDRITIGDVREYLGCAEIKGEDAYFRKVAKYIKRKTYKQKSTKPQKVKKQPKSLSKENEDETRKKIEETQKQGEDLLSQPDMRRDEERREMKLEKRAELRDQQQENQKQRKELKKQKEQLQEKNKTLEPQSMEVIQIVSEGMGINPEELQSKRADYKLLPPEEQAKIRKRDEDAKAEQKKWKPEMVVPINIINDAITLADEQEEEIEADRVRGIPPEFRQAELSKGYVASKVQEKYRTMFPEIDKYNGKVAFTLSWAPRDGTMEYLRNEIATLLEDINDNWDKVKEIEGQKEGKETKVRVKSKNAICQMVIDNITNVGNAKGVIGELNAIVYYLHDSTNTQAVSVGGEEKKLPKDREIGKKKTQEVDVRVKTENGERIYVEAKYDAKTLISKFRTDSETEFVPQQERYQELAKKELNKKTKNRRVAVVIQNTHDWLLLFAGRGAVASKLVNGGWTLVSGRREISTQAIGTILKNVESYCTHYDALLDGIREEWAEWASSHSEPTQWMGEKFDVKNMHQNLNFSKDLLKSVHQVQSPKSEV